MNTFQVGLLLFERVKYSYSTKYWSANRLGNVLILQRKQILIIISNCPIHTNFLIALSLNTCFQSKWWKLLWSVGIL
jgi:hypothetical protein